MTDLGGKSNKKKKKKKKYSTVVRHHESHNINVGEKKYSTFWQI